MSQAQINRLKADMQRKRQRYTTYRNTWDGKTVLPGMKTQIEMTLAAYKAAYEQALAKLNAARAARDAAASASSSDPYALARSIAEANQPQAEPYALARSIAEANQPTTTSTAYPAAPVRPYMVGYGPALRRLRARRFQYRQMRRARADARSSREAFDRKMARAAFLQKTQQYAPTDEMGAIAMELGALEMELDAIHADMNGFGGMHYDGMHYGDLGADGRGATAAGASAAGAAGGAAALYAIGGGAAAGAGAGSTIAAGAGIAAGGAGAAGTVATTLGVGAGLAVAAPAALAVAAVAAPAAGVAWLASWRASTKNVARLQKKIKALRKKMKLAVANAKSRGKKRRLKRRYQRRIDRAKNRLDRIKRVMRRRIQRAKRAGKMDKVKKLRAMRRAAQYGRGRKKMLARKKRRQAKRAAAQGESGEAAALEAEAAQIDSLPDESFTTSEDYELDPEIAAQLGPGALAVQQARMAQGLPPTASQASINRANVLNAILRRQRQNATGLDDDMLMDETMPPDSYDDMGSLGAPSLLRDEEGKIKPVVYVAAVGALLFGFSKMRQKKG